MNEVEIETLDGHPSTEDSHGMSKGSIFVKLGWLFLIKVVDTLLPHV
jgi:hypothetical protein